MNLESVSFHLPVIGWKNVEVFKNYTNSKMSLKYTKCCENAKERVSRFFNVFNVNIENFTLVFELM